MIRKFLPALLAVVVFGIILRFAPAWWCQRGAAEWFDGNLATQQKLARTVVRQVEAGLTTADFDTKSELFNGEWLFGTYMMAGVGLCQIVEQHPAELAQWKPGIETCIRQLLSPAVRAFDKNSWREDALDTLQGPTGHAAYLGYLNFLLGMYRQLVPDNEFVPLHDAITECLMRRINTAPNGLIATYPDEWYPVDNASVLGSIALHGKATRRDYSAFLAAQEKRWRSQYLDPATGLLIQAANVDGTERDGARGSGSTLGLFFLTRALPELSTDLYKSIRTHLVGSKLGFGTLREFPKGVNGRIDIDSGPVVCGIGFSASGFGGAGARAYRDREVFTRLYGSVILGGIPVRENDTLDFITAGPLGNAILLAVFTTPFAQP